MTIPLLTSILVFSVGYGTRQVKEFNDPEYACGYALELGKDQVVSVTVFVKIWDPGQIESRYIEVECKEDRPVEVKYKLVPKQK